MNSPNLNSLSNSLSQMRSEVIALYFASTLDLTTTSLLLAFLGDQIVPNKDTISRGESPV